ncbi:transporter substrate-binding domain-containing protein [Bradyrhizobium sp.]|uniref:transporter substrate-binding domain-containing protein n=1 Tax=Bradyrhizobium sp. TaxID=376 RepID=UPI003BAEB196
MKWFRLSITTVATIAALVSVQAVAQNERELLAPTGRLRVGVYLGSPLSMVHDPATGEARGLSVDLGKELANRLGVPFEQVTYQRVAEVLAAMKAGAVDFTISNATPARATDIAFSQTLLSLELGYLVPATSSVKTLADVNKSGVRVGVTKGSTSERTLPKILASASVVPAENLKQAIDLLARGELDAFATNKPILFEMLGSLPGGRVLDGNWGQEHIAIAIPKGRDKGMEYVRHFVDDVQANGTLAQAVSRAGLRGVLEVRN